MSRYIMAHDLGTSGHKCSVFNLNGKAVASASMSYPTYYGERGAAEQDPADWWEAVVQTTRSVLERVEPASIAAIGFSAHMMGVCPVDHEGTPLGRAMIHADTRSAELEQEAFSLIDPVRFYERTGNRLDSHYPLLKLLWLKRRRPDIYRRAAHFVQAKDYLVWKMSGMRGITDFSDASLTGMFHIGKCRWDDDIMAAFGIESAKLPDIVPSATPAGGVTAEAAAATGLLPGTPVILGGGDGSCAALGAGAIAPGDAYVYLGTTAWVSRVVGAPALDTSRRIFTMCGPTAGLYNALGTMQTAGAAYQWAVRELASRESLLAGQSGQTGQIGQAGQTGQSPYELVENEIGKLPWGADGLLFHPYLMGERSPLWDEEVRSLFFGLSLSHTRFHMLRAVLEGVAYALRSIAEPLQESIPIDRYTVIGGGMKSPAWREIMASALDAPIRVPLQMEEATSLGAAMSAGVAIGAYADYADAWRQFDGGSYEYKPQADRDRVLAGYSLYRELYDRLQELYPQLQQLR